MYGSSNGQGVQAVPFPGGSSRGLVPPPPRQGGGGGFSAVPRQGPKGAFSFYETLSLFLVPTLTFGVFSALFMNVFYKSAHIVLMLLSIGIGVCIVQVWKGMNHRGGVYGTYLSSFTLAALLLSSLIGVVVFELFIKEYWFLHDSNTYTNVLPSEAAEGYLDAGKLLFSEGSRVDVQKAVGYKDRSVYCVAPILDDMQADRVQFWAVGTDCCGQRGSFNCDDAWNAKARGGVAFKIDAATRWDSYFGKAVKQAEAAFSLASAKDVLFVRWVVDPEQVELNYWRVARAVVLISCAVFGFLAFVAVSLLNTALKGFVNRQR